MTSIEIIKACTKALVWVSPACPCKYVLELDEETASKYGTIADCINAQVDSIPVGTELSIMIFRQDAEAFPMMMIASCTVGTDQVQYQNTDCTEGEYIFPILREDAHKFF